MKRWVVGAALAAAGSLFVHPLEAQTPGQAFEPGVKNATLLCSGVFNSSWVAMRNLNKIKGPSVCRWKCVYRTQSGGSHINAGTRTLAYNEQVSQDKTTKRVSGQIWKVGGTGSCVRGR
jgi:hypothetical protein